jgi:hypothetical protein
MTATELQTLLKLNGTTPPDLKRLYKALPEDVRAKLLRQCGQWRRGARIMIFDSKQAVFWPKALL